MAVCAETGVTKDRQRSAPCANAGFHVVEQVAVEGPAALGIGRNVDIQRRAWLDVDYMLQRIAGAVADARQHPHAGADAWDGSSWARGKAMNRFVMDARKIETD